MIAMIIDFHTHAFPEKIAKDAMDILAHTAGALSRFTDGTLRGLSDAANTVGDVFAVVLPIASKPTQMRKISDWAAENRTEKIEIFGSVYPGAPDAMYELEGIKARGLKGVKFHPEHQDFYIDEPHCLSLYKKAASLGLITVFHMGYDIGFLPPCRGAPERLKKVLGAFDGAPVIAAHFGGYMMWERVAKTLCGLPIYFDTSYSHSRMIKPLAQRIVEKHGPAKILFGSDLPWSGIAEEIAFVNSLDLTAGDRDLIMRGNAARLLELAHRQQ
jgi:predicted TIM-barrel fold metal-dependent hydrolase